jgi:hypothetical protein
LQVDALFAEDLLLLVHSKFDLAATRVDVR